MEFPTTRSGLTYTLQKNSAEWEKTPVDFNEIKVHRGGTSDRSLVRTKQIEKKQELTMEFEILSEIDHYFSWLMGDPIAHKFSDYDCCVDFPELELILVQLSEQGVVEFETEEDLSICLDQIMFYGQDRVKISMGNESILLRHGATLAAFKHHVKGSLKPTLDVCDISQIKPENIANEKPAKGGKMSVVTEITYKNGAVWFFKPIKNNTINQEIRINAAVISGISPNDSRFAQRSMFAYQMSEILGFHVIPPVMLSKNKAGELGYIQEKALGYCGIEWLDHLHTCGKLDLLFANSDIVRQMIELQLLDALTGECDRHAHNYFIDLETNKVSGIDNDASGGFLVTHPHSVITRYREDGYRPGKFNEHEKKTVEHIKSFKLRESVTLIKNAGAYPRGVFLPPVMDWNMVEKFKKLDVNRFLESMSLFEFNNSEKEAAASRLAAILSHIDVLEQRLAREQRLGCPDRSIIHPHEWGKLTTTHRLMPQEKHVGNALLACASYLERDAKLASEKIAEYQEPTWVLEAREKGTPVEARYLPQKVKWKLFQWHNPF